MEQCQPGWSAKNTPKAKSSDDFRLLVETERKGSKFKHKQLADGIIHLPKNPSSFSNVLSFILRTSASEENKGVDLSSQESDGWFIRLKMVREMICPPSSKKRNIFKPAFIINYLASGPGFSQQMVIFINGNLQNGSITRNIFLKQNAWQSCFQPIFVGQKCGAAETLNQGPLCSSQKLPLRLQPGGGAQTLTVISVGNDFFDLPLPLHIIT